MWNSRVRHRAFTLVEMMTVVSVIGIAGGLAAFTMSEQIADARAKAEAKVVLQDLRAEHRAAREQMFGLKVTAPGAHVVRFQHARGPHCAESVGDAREHVYEGASLHIAVPADGACFNARGEPDTAGPQGAQAPEPVVMTIEATLARPDTTFMVPLRIDRAGIIDLPGQKLSEEELKALYAQMEGGNFEKIIDSGGLGDPGELKIDPLPPDGTGDPNLFLPQDPSVPICKDGNGLVIDCTTVITN